MSWPLPLIEVDAGTVLYRLTRLHFPNPAYFGRAALFRFDAPDRSFGVCYLGTNLDCCLLEVVTPTYRATAVPQLIIARAQLSSYYAAMATVTRPLRLAYLTDETPITPYQSRRARGWAGHRRAGVGARRGTQFGTFTLGNVYLIEHMFLIEAPRAGTWRPISAAVEGA